MKIIFSNKIYNIPIPNIISVFHCKKIISKYFEFPENCSFILKHNNKIVLDNEIVFKNNEYEIIIEKKGGSSLANPKNSIILMIIIAFVFGISSIFYFMMYKYFTLDFNKSVGEKLKEKYKFKNEKKEIKVFDCSPEDIKTWYKRWWHKIKRFFNCNEKWLSFWNGVKKFFNYIFGIYFEKMADKNFQKCSCGMNVYFSRDTEYYKKTDSSWVNVFTNVLFYTYMFVILLPMIILFFVSTICTSGKTAKYFFINLGFLLVPLVLCLTIPYITKYLTIGLSYFTNIDCTKYKIAISNLILLFFLLINLLSNQSVLTPAFYISIIGVIAFFVIIKHKFFFITRIISVISTLLSNLLFLEDDPYNKVPYEDPLNPNQCSANPKGEPAPECFMRYRWIYDLLDTGIIGFFSIIITTYIFFPQIEKLC